MFVTCKTLYYVVHKPQNPFEAFLLILLTIKVLELHLTYFLEHSLKNVWLTSNFEFQIDFSSLES